MLIIENLGKRADKGMLLGGIALTAEKGQCIGIAGLPGAGKTTLTDIIAGAAEADDGRVELNGLTVEKESSAARLNIGYAPAQDPAYPDMTPRSFLRFLADARGIGGREANQMIDDALKLLGIRDAADQPMGALNAGTMKLVNIAQAVFFKPELIVIDDLTAGLDPKEILAVRGAIAQLKEDHIVLLASDNLTELTRLADKVYVLAGGKFVASGSPAEMHNMTALDGTLTVTVAGDAETAKALLQKVGGVKITSISSDIGESTIALSMQGDKRAEIASALVGGGAALLGMEPGRRTLDALLAFMTEERF